MRPATRLIHHPGSVCEHTGAVNFPIYEASTFKQDEVGHDRGYDYSRSGNPTREVLERYIADLEAGEFGFAFASGMAAISACLLTLRSGDHLVATEGLYGGTYRVLTRIFQDFGLDCTFADTGDLDAVASAVQDNTRAVLIETPANPTMRITDIRGVAEIARANGALVVVDNTFMSPWLQRPLELGADIVVHSATKFLSGHSDVIAGLAVTKDKRLASKLGRVQNAVGAILSPIDSWLLMKGMKTLAVRMLHSQASASRIAEWLLTRDEVEDVFYPSLMTGPQADGHARQADGPGAMISFRVRDGLAAEAMLTGLSVWTLAVSLGGVESIATLPAKMTHLSYPREELSRLGITDNFVRLSVGIEDVDDLIADLETAFQRAGLA